LCYPRHLAAEAVSEAEETVEEKAVEEKAVEEKDDPPDLNVTVLFDR